MDAVRAVAISKSYAEVRAVSALDLVVPQGQIVAILGPNGAGKTTTIEMLLGLRTPDSGRVELFGMPPGNAAARARVGSMLQDSDGPEALTVAETVSLVRHYYPFALPVADVLSRADLTAKADNKIGQLSGGQRQRLSFALAIVGDPDLLFLDEPTAALDVVARAAFWTQVRGFADLGKTILFSSHNLAETDAVADRIVVIHQGRLLRDGTPASIKAAVAAKTVHLLTDATVADVQRVEGVRQVDIGTSGRHGSVEERTPADLARLVVQTSQPERLLATLFGSGRVVRDLTVLDTDLETAFIHLTSTSSATKEQAA